MKRIIFMAVLSAIAGYLLGDMVRATAADRRYAHEILTSKSQDAAARAKPRLVGNRTTVLAPRDEEDDQSTDDPNLPPEIRAARALGAKARLQAMKEIIYNEKHGILGKDRGWGMGGPYFPLTDFSHLLPRERPLRVVAVPGSYGTFAYDPPFAVADPVGYAFMIGPGDPTIVPHTRLIEEFVAPPSVPEPTTWTLLILSFGALGWRMRMTRRASA